LRARRAADERADKDQRHGKGGVAPGRTHRPSSDGIAARYGYRIMH
jgi:hypothetical protein